MKHSIDHYSAIVSTVRGSDEVDFPKHPTNEAVPCNLQEATSEIVELYKGRKERIKASCFLCDKDVFNSIHERDLLVFQGINFYVIGKQDLCFLGEVFRVDLAEDLGG
jgi:hypothetical protein